MKNCLLVAAIVLPMLSSVTPCRAVDYGIFVDGSYGPGETDMNALVDQRVDTARATFQQRHPEGQSWRVDNKPDLQTILGSIACGEGDTITIVLVGHGRGQQKDSKEYFYFAESPQTVDQRFSANELTGWIAAAAEGCQCKVYVVIFSCHSGGFITELFKEQHVQAVFASSLRKELTYTSATRTATGIQDNGDWMSGFNTGWANAPPGASIAEALAEAAESAARAISVEHADKQHPCGWQKGDQLVKAHVEKDLNKNHVSAKVVFWNPIWARGQEASIRLPRGADFTERYKDCDWIQFTGSFGQPQQDGKITQHNVRMAGAPAPCPAPPSDRVTGHVIGRQGNELTIHTVRPSWQHCKTRRLTSSAPVDPGVQKGSWIEQPVSVLDPNGDLATEAPVRPANPSMRIGARIQGPADPLSNRIPVHIVSPDSLQYLGNFQIQLSQSQASLSAEWKPRDLLQLNLILREIRQNVYEATDILHTAGLIFRNDAALEPISPPGTVSVNHPFSPAFTVRNAGIEALQAAYGVARISLGAATVYEESIPVSLESGRRSNLQFPNWTPSQPGHYVVEYQISTADDENPYNNAIRADLMATPDPPESSAAAAWSATDLNSGNSRSIEEVESAVLINRQGSGFSEFSGDHAIVAWQQFDGDWSIECFVSPPPTGGAGLMARASLNYDARCIGLEILADQSLRFYHRDSDGAGMSFSSIAGAHPGGVWLQLTRTDDDFEAAYSSDGVDWKSAGVLMIPGFPADCLGSLCGYTGSAPPDSYLFEEVAGFLTAVTPMPRPGNVTANAMGPDSIRIDWVDQAETEIGYAIQRAVGDGDYEDLIVLGPNTTTYLDQGLAPASLYRYQVRARKRYVDVDWSHPAFAETNGMGLQTWASLHGISDPFSDEFNTGLAPVFYYFAGADPGGYGRPHYECVESNGVHGVKFHRHPGIHDLILSIDHLDSNNQWIQIYQFDDTPSGDQISLIPPNDGNGGVARLRLSLKN